jgi:hypothetical protein
MSKRNRIKGNRINGTIPVVKRRIRPEYPNLSIWRSGIRSDGAIVMREPYRNTDHQTDYIAPIKRRKANGEWKGVA